jgi:hypothetical protein
MSKPRVVWSGVPAEHKAAFAPYVKRYLPFLPCWVATLTITYTNEPPIEPGDVVFLEVSAQEEMRTLELFYRPGWMECDETTREELVSHEFAHVPYLPAANMVDSILKDVNASKALTEQWTLRVEAATQDTARILRAAVKAA